jgi:uncharacterized delta-60 repeat protein
MLRGRAGRWAVGCLVSCCSLAGASLAQAAPGDLDSSFGSGGVARVDLGATEFANGVAVGPDGRIVVAGTSQSAGNESMLVARLAAGGALDTSFGFGTGAAHVQIGTGMDEGNGMVLQPDGKIVVVGTDSNGPAALVARFTSAGALDGGFGTDGLTQVAPPMGAALGRGVALQPDGKILLGGDAPFSGGSNALTARLQGSDGSLDHSFGGGIVLDGAEDSHSHEFNGYAVAAAPNGDVRTAGDASEGIGDPSNFLVTSFSVASDADRSDGFELGSDSHARAIAVEADGGTLVAGYSNANGGDFAVMRLTNDLQPDPSFGTAGHAFVDLGGLDSATGMVVQPDGKIVLAGSSQAPGGKPQVAVVRLQPNGSLDSTFGKGGKVVVPGPAGVSEFANSVALTPDGKIVVAGSARSGSNSDLLVVRLQGDSGGASGGGGAGGGGAGGSGPGASAVPRCEGHKATIIGTNGKDKLTGTKRADVIVGLGGNDTINGGGGNDIICAGNGNDRVNGGAGNDRIDGGAGNDNLSGAGGKDSLTGDAGNDRLDGGGGNDSLAGGAGKDNLTGDAGNDHLDGGAGNDSLNGGAGSDKLTGDAGNDKLSGGSGKDQLSGGSGRNTDHQ